MAEPIQQSPTDPDLLLLRKWAPILNISPNEQYRPSSVDWYASQCQLIDAAGDIVSGTSTGITDPSILADSTVDQHLGYRLHPLNQAVYNGPPDTPLNNVPCYGFVRTLNDADGQLQFQDLVYWFFYPYNGNIFDIGTLAGYLTAQNLLVAGITSIFFWPGLLLLPVIALDAVTSVVELAYSWDGLGKHEGDWETVIVRLAADGTFQSMYFSEHSGMTARQASGITWSNDQRPCVYVAQNSHANYPTPGTQSLDGGLAEDVSVDCANNPGFLWDTQSSIVNIGWFQGTLNKRLANWTALQGLLPTACSSIAVNNNRFWIAGGGTPNNAAPTYVNNGRSSETTLTMSNPMPPWPATQAVSPGVSINDSGVFIATYAQNNQPWAIAGALDSITSNVEVWTETAVRYDPGTTSGPASIALSNAIGGSRCVWVAVHRYGNQYFWDGGTIDEATRSIAPWAQNTRLDYGTSDPVVAINDNGTVLSVHSGVPNGSTTECCYYNAGSVNPSAKTVSWSSGVSLGPGSNPSVAITNKGLVLIAYVNDPTGNSTIYYRVGMLEPASGAIAWAGDALPLTFDQSRTGTGGGTSCAILEDGTAFICFYPRSTPFSAYPCTIVQGSLGEDWSQWTPPAGAAWSTFSGRWGGPPQGNALLSFGNKEIYPVGDAPQGPLQHSDYFFGPA